MSCTGEGNGEGEQALLLEVSKAISLMHQAKWQKLMTKQPKTDEIVEATRKGEKIMSRRVPLMYAFQCLPWSSCWRAWAGRCRRGSASRDSCPPVSPSCCWKFRT